MSKSSDDPYDYWAKTKKTILVPIEITCHDPTDTVFTFKPPSLQDCEKALRESFNKES